MVGPLKAAVQVGLWDRWLAPPRPGCCRRARRVGHGASCSVVDTNIVILPRRALLNLLILLLILPHRPAPAHLRGSVCRGRLFGTRRSEQGTRPATRLCAARCARTTVRRAAGSGIKHLLGKSTFSSSCHGLRLAGGVVGFFPRPVQLSTGLLAHRPCELTFWRCGRAWWGWHGACCVRTAPCAVILSRRALLSRQAPAHLRASICRGRLPPRGTWRTEQRARPAP